VDSVVSSGRNHQNLAERRISLDVARLLQQIGANAAGLLAEILGDVENCEAGVGTERRRETGAGKIDRRSVG
jgi:hypothetical protein